MNDEAKTPPKEEIHETKFTEGGGAAEPGSPTGTDREPPSGEAGRPEDEAFDVRFSDVGIGFLASTLFGPRPEADAKPPNPEKVAAAFAATARGWLDRWQFDDALDLYMLQHGVDVSKVNPLWLVGAGVVTLIGTAVVYYRIAHPKPAKQEEEKEST